jgi:hypothetical protein
MTRRQDDPTAVAQEIIDLIGGATGLSRLRAARVEALSDGVIFNLMTDSMTTEGIVVIRKVGKAYRVYVAMLSKWIEARCAEGVEASDVRSILWKLIGKHEPAF